MMMAARRWMLLPVLLGFAAAAAGQVTETQAKRIRGALPEKARAVPKEPRRVLVWNTPLMESSPHKGYTIPQGEYALKLLGETTGAYEPVVSDDLAMVLPENLERFDAIVMNNSCGRWVEPTDAVMEKLGKYGDRKTVEMLLRRSLLDFVAKGGGIFAYHFAIGANRHWPEFQELLGAGYWGHPWNEEVGVRVEEPSHPLVAAFGGEGFRIADEIYQFREPYSRDRVRVLLSLDTETTNMDVEHIHRKDGDFALAWVRRHGEGRVFYCALGHRTETWWNPDLLRFFLDGIQFATGDIEAPAEPRAEDADKPEAGAAWPMHHGPRGNFIPRRYGVELVDDLSKARLEWKSEDRDLGCASAARLSLDTERRSSSRTRSTSSRTPGHTKKSR